MHVNDKHMKTSCIRCALIIIINTCGMALQYLMASNVERERATKGEKRGLEGEESAIILEGRGKLLKKDTQGL